MSTIPRIKNHYLCSDSSSSSSGSSVSEFDGITSSWKTTSGKEIPKALKVAQSAASKEKQNKKDKKVENEGIETPSKRPKRTSRIIDYKEKQARPPKAIASAKKTKATAKFFNMEEMRVDIKDRMKDDFEDFIIAAGRDAYLIHHKRLEKVRVKEVIGGKARISHGTGNCTSWVKATQLLGNYDGETREGRVCLLKSKNHAPVLVKIKKTGISKHMISNFHEEDGPASFEVFANKLKMASPLTLRGFRKSGKSTAKKSKKSLGAKSGQNFSLEEFFKAQTARDDAQNKRTMQVIESQGEMFGKVLAAQQQQMNQLISAMREGAAPRIEKSSDKTDKSKADDEDGNFGG